jgi:hypothetical protein
MAAQRLSVVRAAASRSRALSLANTCSIGSGRASRAAGRAGWRRASRPPRTPPPRPCVAAEVVHNQHVAGPQRRGEELPHVGEEALAVDGAVQHQRRDDALGPQCGDHGGGPPVPVRHGVEHALAARRPAVAPRHVRGGPGLVEEHEARGVERRLRRGPGPPRLGYVRPVLFRRPDLLFCASGPAGRASATPPSG